MTADPTTAQADLLSALRRLAERPCCVTDLTEASEMLQPKVSRHLGVLRDAGLVACHVEGRRRCYEIANPELVRSLFAWLDGLPPFPAERS